MKKIGITGNKGFIGGYIQKELEKNREMRIFGFDLPTQNILDSNLGKLVKFVKNKDIIIHAAAINRGTDFDIVASNVVGTYNLIKAVLKLKKKPKIIFLSSIHAAGNTVFGLAKRLAEIMLADFSIQWKTPVSIFRLTNVFGEHCRPFYNSVVATFCYQAANGEKITIHPGSKNKKINLIYVAEVGQIIAKEVFIDRKRYFFFKQIDSKNEISVGNLAKLIKSFRNRPKLKSKFEKDLYNTYLSYLNGK